MFITDRKKDMSICGENIHYLPAHAEVQQEDLPRSAPGKLLEDVLRDGGEVSFEETM